MTVTKSILYYTFLIILESILFIYKKFAEKQHAALLLP